MESYLVLVCIPVRDFSSVPTGTERNEIYNFDRSINHVLCISLINLELKKFINEDRILQASRI
jgi:hypothetical protein